jgi:hypothetical protein
MPSEQCRYFRLIYAEDVRGFDLAEFSLLDDRGDFENQVGLCLKNVGIRQSEIAKNTAAASGYYFWLSFLLFAHAKNIP